jgi:O-antigen ligase
LALDIIAGGADIARREGSPPVPTDAAEAGSPLDDHRWARAIARAVPGRASVAWCAGLGALALSIGDASPARPLLLAAAAVLAAACAVILPTHWLLYVVIVAIPFDNFAVPVGPLSVSVSDGLLVIIAVRWLLAVLHRGGRIARSELYAPAAVFYALLLPSFFVTFDLAASLRQGFSILMMLLTAILAGNLLRSERRLMGAATAVLIASAAISALALVQLWVWNRYQISPFQPNVDVVTLGGLKMLRLTATYFDPNYFALYLIGPLVVGLFVALDGQRSARYRAFAWSIVLLDLAVFLMTFSRGGWVTLLAFMTLFVLLRARAPGRAVWAVMLIAVIVAAPVVASVLVQMNPQSILNRTSLLQLGLEVMTQHPLTGTGLGTFRYLPENPLGKRTHSIYLQVGADAGVPALLAFLWLALVVAFNAVRGLRVAPRGPTRAVLLGTACALGCLAIQGAFLDALIAKYLWIFVGMASAAAAVARESHSPASEPAASPEAGGPRPASSVRQEA